MPVKRDPQTAVLQGLSAGWNPCLLTWYDPALGGTNSASGAPDPHSRTSSGEPYDAAKDTCAAPPAYPFGTMLVFQYQGKQVTCKVNDRGGAIQGSHFDLSRHAADTLGIIATGSAQAQFQVGGVGGAPAQLAPSSSGSSSGSSGSSGGGGADLLTILGDLVSFNVTDLALQLAIATAEMVKDVALGIGDWIVIPWWHWNQLAAQYYIGEELFSKDPKRWVTMPWTAAFWGLGYWLFWTDPEAKSLSPAPIRNSRAAKHVRGLQSIPARRSLIKPKDVKARTARKPKPVASRAAVTQTGTMQVTRSMPVKVTGAHAREPNPRSEVPIQREGTLPTSRGKLSETISQNPTRRADSQHRAGSDSPPNSEGVTRRGKEPGGNGRNPS